MPTPTLFQPYKMGRLPAPKPCFDGADDPAHGC